MYSYFPEVMITLVVFFGAAIVLTAIVDYLDKHK
jgi:hypothetical protein